MIFCLCFCGINYFIQVEYSHLLNKIFHLLKHNRVGIYNYASTIKNEIGLGSAVVDIKNRNFIFSCISFQGFYSSCCVIIIKRGRRNIQHHFRFYFILYQNIHGTSFVHRIIISNIPKIFTNSKCYFSSFKFYVLKFCSRFKISVFIKNIVSWQ